MRILDMTTLVALARHRHFGRTALELHTTQPAISARLAALEREFGCRLVVRGNADFALTPEGEKVLKTFEAVLRDVEGLKHGLANNPAPILEVVRIGVIDTISSTWMTHFVEATHASFPQLKLELSVEGTKNLVQGMHEGGYDLIFSLDPAIGEGFRSFVSCTFEMSWAGSPRLINPDRIYSVEELSQLPIITFPKGTPPYRMVAPYFQDEQVLASKLTSSNSLYSIINLLIDGFGVGAIPTVTIRRELKAGLLHALNVSKRFPPMPIIATYQSSTHHELIRRVVEQARVSARAYCATVEPSMVWVD